MEHLEIAYDYERMFDDKLKYVREKCKEFKSGDLPTNHTQEIYSILSSLKNNISVIEDKLFEYVLNGKPELKKCIEDFQSELMDTFFKFAVIQSLNGQEMEYENVRHKYNDSLSIYMKELTHRTEELNKSMFFQQMNRLIQKEDVQKQLIGYIVKISSEYVGKVRAVTISISKSNCSMANIYIHLGFNEEICIGTVNCHHARLNRYLVSPDVYNANNTDNGRIRKGNIIEVSSNVRGTCNKNANYEEKKNVFMSNLHNAFKKTINALEDEYMI